jgi:hypothetical protein
VAALVTALQWLRVICSPLFAAPRCAPHLSASGARSKRRAVVIMCEDVNGLFKCPKVGA